MAKAKPVGKNIQEMDEKELGVELDRRFSNQVHQSRETPPELNDNNYNFNHPNRGLAVIMNNEKFNVNKWRDRKGAEFDVSNLRTTLDVLGFHVEVFNNLKKWQMLFVAEKAASLYPHKNADCFVCVLLSYGVEKEDKKGDIIVKIHALIDVDGDRLETHKIIDCFTDNNCSSLTDKPKLFFIQACRGNNEDPGVPLERDEVEGKKEQKPGDPSNCNDLKTCPSLLHPNFLIMYATPSGYVAWRRNSGSWFIKELCKFLNQENVGDKSLLRGLTTVMRKVAIEYCSNTNGAKAVPVLETLLTKDIYMTRKKKVSDVN